jgi:hypothetical protein
MNSQSFTESIVEQAALAWLESLGWQIAHGPEIAPISQAQGGPIMAKSFSTLVCVKRSQGSIPACLLLP